MTTELERLCAEAAALAGGEHPCHVLGHKWKSIGGRACPFGECGESQGVHECTVCGDVDYGQRDGEPGYDWCRDHGFNCGGNFDR